MLRNRERPGYERTRERLPDGGVFISERYESRRLVTAALSNGHAVDLPFTEFLERNQRRRFFMAQGDAVETLQPEVAYSALPADARRAVRIAAVAHHGRSPDTGSPPRLVRLGLLADPDGQGDQLYTVRHQPAGLNGMEPYPDGRLRTRPLRHEPDRMLDRPVIAVRHISDSWMAVADHGDIMRPQYRDTEPDRFLPTDPKAGPEANAFWVSGSARTVIRDAGGLPGTGEGGQSAQERFLIVPVSFYAIAEDPVDLIPV